MDYRPLLAQVTRLKALLTGAATDSYDPRFQGEYSSLRQALLDQEEVRPILPPSIVACRLLGEFRAEMQTRAETYRERRAIIRSEFDPLLTAIEEGQLGSPADAVISDRLSELRSAEVERTWRKALDRRSTDPDGAITSARTLLEDVCKQILDERRKPHSASDDLPTLYRAVASGLNLAPSQETEQIFKQILGGCTSVVQGLAGMRNRLSDSHGLGAGEARAQSRHASLAVNLAGAMALFLVETWAQRRPDAKGGD